MTKAIDAFLDKKTSYKHAAEPEAEKAKERPKEIPRGEGGARGRSVAPGEPEFRVSSKERNDALWMRDNQKKFQAASSAGLLVFDD